MVLVFLYKSLFTILNSLNRVANYGRRGEGYFALRIRTFGLRCVMLFIHSIY